MLNYRAAMICAMIAEVNRDRKKRNRPYTPEDFMPKKRKPKLSQDQMVDQIKMVNVALGGEVK